ncbi:HEAT repeat domain-containing protein [Tengunoibacter tsumagoiensis]|uniref:HEAT repeat domain-containing protein n=1 Tax=Tengunoibacter tsumagoiensis TaxID=2014871 RepID=A0A402A2D0_9CHLR|nr:hypothetical protein [Tengunoibacter tsumagoiensis]GCE13300.1 hypothetical protein KTT_31590 [Tengunoibacter tsumagoiensis]
MPRGRKGPPQESVDSILLAVSRREDIDAETMSHYMDRLDEEWAESAREKVLHLLQSNDAMAQAAALRILTELATDFDLEGLEDFVADPTISDLAKLSLAPILKELGSEMADDGIIEYLNDPAGAIRQMQMRLLELVDQDEMGIETILEDVVSMPLERRFAFIGWLGNSNDPRAASLLIPLLENQSGKIVTAVIESLEQLGPIAVHQTMPALNRLMTTTSNRQIKQLSRAVLGRLTMQSMLGVEDAAMIAARSQPLPPYEARVSSIDGSGAQLIMLSWQRPDGLVKGVNVLSLDQKGIKDCYGVDEMDAEQWKSLVDDLQEQGFSNFSVPFEYARALIIEARALNKRSRFKLPIAYSIWRPLIEIRPVEQSEVGIIADPLPLTPATYALGQRGDELYQIKEFASWLFEPMEAIEPYIGRYWTAQDLSEGSGRGRTGRKSKAREAEQRALLEQIVKEAIEELVDDKWRILYQQRLLRQVALFKQAGRQDEVPLLQAVATLLDPASGISVLEQPFPRALFRISIEQGPLRLMVESLRHGMLNAFPIDMFQPD